MSKNNFLLAVKTSIPVFFGYITCGIAYGLVLVEADYPWWLAPFSGITMFAGAGQFIAVGLFAAGTPITMILITELLVNIRHIVYGLSLITKFNSCGKWKPYLIFSLSDETYSLHTTTEVPEGENPGSFYGTIALCDQFYWVLGSLIGAVAGELIPFDLTGVDFALTALFAVLMVDQIEKTRDFVPVLIGAITTIGAVILWKFGIINSSSNILLVALSLGIAAISITKRKEYIKEKNTSEDK